MMAIIGITILIGLGATFFLWSTPRARDLDTHPITKQVQTAEFDPVTAHVAVEIDTGGDQMGMRPKQAGLRLLVEYGTTLQYQLFASCNHAAMWGPSSDTLQFPIEAECDTRTIHVLPEGKDVIAKEISGSSEKVLARIRLPENIQKIERDDNLRS